MNLIKKGDLIKSFTSKIKNNFATIQKKDDTFAIVGCGLAGMYMSRMLSEMGYKTDIYEKREKIYTDPGRSI